MRAGKPPRREFHFPEVHRWRAVIGMPILLALFLGAMIVSAMLASFVERLLSRGGAWVQIRGSAISALATVERT